MFHYCVDPQNLDGFYWWSCYLTTVKHISFYKSFLVVFALLIVTVPLILFFGFMGAIARQSKLYPVRLFGVTYTSIVRGVPDIIFFLFVPIALDQGIEYLRHKIKCPDWTDPIRQGNDFVVCQIAKMPVGSSEQWIHETYGFFLAALAFSVVFGAFAANTINGAINAIPPAQIETGSCLWNVKKTNIHAHSISTNVGICLTRIIKSLDDTNQSYTVIISTRSTRYSLLGKGAWWY
jgi:polar amino acid transport system permease protein